LTGLFRQIQVGALGLLNLLIFLLLLAFVLGSGVFEPLSLAVLLFELPLVVVELPPSRQVVVTGQFRAVL